VRNLKGSWERAKIVREWKAWASRISEAVRRVLGDETQIFVFGSSVRNEETAASDIDILIVKGGLPASVKARGEIKAAIEKEAGLPLLHPFELHLADKGEAEAYFRRIRKEVLKL
jgi:predicted nucleotidyltransferase